MRCALASPRNWASASSTAAIPASTPPTRSPPPAAASSSKPAYRAKARTEFSTGKITRQELDKLEKQATEYWIRAQEKVGLDVLVHGEMERGDMVAYFSGEPGGRTIEGMRLGGLVRSYGNRYYHKTVIHDKLTWPGPM